MNKENRLEGAVFFAIAILWMANVFSVGDDRLLLAYDSYVIGEKAVNIAERREAFNRALSFYAQIERDYLYDDGRLYANIGNCFFQLEEYGWSIFYYRKALMKMPREEKIRKNLETAQKKTGTLQEDRIFFANYRFSKEECVFFSALCFFFWIVFFSFYLWLRYKILGFISLFLGVGGIFFSASLLYFHFLFYGKGICVQSTLLHCDAGSHYALVRKSAVLPGEQVKILLVHENGEWCKVLLSDGSVGYVHSQTFRSL